jgi:hypothetical protein
MVASGWDWYEHGRPIAGIEKLIGQCDALTPDTEDFQIILVSSALDAANVVLCLLQTIADAEAGVAADAAELAADLVDMYVQELESMDRQAPDLEQRIANHPLMRAECQRQLEDLSLLESGIAPREARLRWASPPVSSLGL